MRRRWLAYRQLHPPAWPGSGLSPVNRAIVVLILIATVVGILQSEPMVADGRGRLFLVIEMLLGSAFLAEYAVRLWSIVEATPEEAPWRARWRFMRSPAALFDLAAIAASLLPVIGLNGSALRLVRLIRILRIARLGRFSAAFQGLWDAIRSRRYEFAATLALAGVVLIVGATLLHWLEGDLQPDKFGSVPRAMWWAVITLTTIGYGDVYPVTVGGKIVASIVALSGIGLIALPAGLLASSFNDAVAGRANAADGPPGDARPLDSSPGIEQKRAGDDSGAWPT